MSHVDEGTLHTLLDGELSDAEARAVEAHLDRCAACRAAFEEARSFFKETDALIRVLDEDDASAARPVSPPRRRLPAMRTMGLAASLLIAAGATMVIYQSTGEPAQTPPVADDSGVRGAAPSEPEATANQPAPQPMDERREEQQLRQPAPPAPRPPATPAEREDAKEAFADAADEPPAIEEAAKAEAEVDALGFASADAAPVTMEVAVASLGGAIRLIDGMTPVRVDTVTAGADEAGYRAGASGAIRVVYQDSLDRELRLEQTRLPTPAAPERNRSADLRRLQQAPAAGAAMRRLEIGSGDTVITQHPDGSVEIRWVDSAGFLLALIGHDRDYLLGLMSRVH